MSQNFTDDCFAGSHVAQEDLQNIENNFAALKSSFSGGSAPANPVAGMWWFDTSANILKIRNEANSAWLDMYDFANQRVLMALRVVSTVVGGTGISVSGNLASGNVTVGISSGGVGSTQLAGGAVTAVKIANYTAGNYVVYPQAAISPSTTSTSMIEMFKARVHRGGTVRVRWRVSVTSGDLCGTRVYVNGSAYGPLRETHIPNTDFYNDVMVLAGETVSIYGFNPNGHTLTIHKPSICCGNPIEPALSWTE